MHDNMKKFKKINMARRIAMDFKMVKYFKLYFFSHTAFQ